MSEIKKDVWEIDVNRQSTLKVYYAEAVTMAEAKELFAEEEFEDILDEEDHGIEVVGAR